MSIVFHELGESDYEEIGTVEDGEIVDGEDELKAIGVDQFADDEERLLRVYDGPYVVAGIGPKTGIEKSEEDAWVEKRVEAVFKEWVPYEGPQGGEGWQNTLTGDVRYQETKPSGEGSGDADITMPANSTLRTVTAAATSILGATVVSSLKSQLRGGEGGSIDPQMFVTAAVMYMAQTGKGSLADFQDELNEEAENEPEDSQDMTVSAGGHEVEMTTTTGVTDITSAITEVDGNEQVARIAMRLDDDEEGDTQAWVEEYLSQVDDPEKVEQIQDALNQRIRERTISTDMYRGGVVVPKEMDLAQTKDASREALGEETFEWLSDAIEANTSVDENDPEAWVRATLTQIGDDNNARKEFQNQFDVSAADYEEEEAEMVTMEGGGESIEMPTNTSAEDARDAIGETFSDDALRLTAHAIEQRGMDVEDPKNWVMTSLTLAQINNPDGFENSVSELQDSLIEAEEPDEEDLDRSAELLNDFESEGDWQSYTDPVSDLLEEGESASDIISALEEYGAVGDHELDDNQIRQIAFDAHREATERNAPIDETADNPTLAMDWGNEFPEAMKERARDTMGDAYETLDDSFGMWSEDPHGPEMASMWNYAMNETGNGNLPEGVEGEPSEEAVEAIDTMRQMNRDTLREVYGDSVPVFRPVSGEAAGELKSAKEEDSEDPIEFSHRPAESWSSDIQQVANRTEFEDEDTVVIRREVPTENILASSMLGNPGMDTEDNQFVVMSQDRTEYETDAVLTGDDLKDSGGVMEQVSWAAETAGDSSDNEGDSE